MFPEQTNEMEEGSPADSCFHSLTVLRLLTYSVFTYLTRVYLLTQAFAYLLDAFAYLLDAPHWAPVKRLEGG